VSSFINGHAFKLHLCLHSLMYTTWTDVHKNNWVVFNMWAINVAPSHFCGPLSLSMWLWMWCVGRWDTWEGRDGSTELWCQDEVDDSTVRAALKDSPDACQSLSVILVIITLIITGSALALHCCKAHAKINGKIENSTTCKIVTHEDFNLKLGTRDYVADITHTMQF